MRVDPGEDSPQAYLTRNQNVIAACSAGERPVSRVARGRYAKRLTLALASLPLDANDRGQSIPQLQSWVPFVRSRSPFPPCAESPRWFFRVRAASVEYLPGVPCSARSQLPAVANAHRAFLPARDRSLREQTPPPRWTVTCPREGPLWRASWFPFPASYPPKNSSMPPVVPSLRSATRLAALQFCYSRCSVCMRGAGPHE